MSLGEVMVWTELRRRQIGWLFRRQHPIGPYLVDFACLKLKLIVEIDGSQHQDSVVADQIRDAYLAARGWTILRFTAYDAVQNPLGVVDEIAEVASRLAGEPDPAA
jgi:very-short-patch-repair endonuclease